MYIKGRNRVVHVFNLAPCLEENVWEWVYSSAQFAGSGKLHSWANSFLWKSLQSLLVSAAHQIKEVLKQACTNYECEMTTVLKFSE
jgi:hypothetical protein